MKHVRIMLLGALTALALTATAGTATAANTICSTNPATGCTAYTGAVNFELARTNNATPEVAKLVGSKFGLPISVSCSTGLEDSYATSVANDPNIEGSFGTGNIATNNPITGTIGTFAFHNCKDQTGANCGVTLAGLPWNVTANNTPLAAGSNGRMSVTMGGATVNCSFGSCSYGSATVTGSVYNPGNGSRPDTTGPDNADGQVHFAGVTLISSDPSCSNGTWSGNYVVRQGTTLGAGGTLWIS